MPQAILHILLACSMVLLSSCQRKFGPGPYRVNLVQPTGANCDYDVQPASIQTLVDLKKMQGQLGSVVYLGRELFSDPAILRSGSGFKTIDTQFSLNDGIVSALDYESLFAVSLYWSIEQGHLLFSQLDERANMISKLPGISDTKIVHQAQGRLEASSKPTTDNAAYFGNFFQAEQELQVKDYFFSFPTEEVKSVPLGINLGVMVHEYTHFVAFHLYRYPFIVERGGYDGLSTEAYNTLSTIDEGIADYFGFLSTKDPTFLQCSLPQESRNLAEVKMLNSQMVQQIKSTNDFDPHDAGAALASALYKIGSQIGFEAMGKALIGTMANLNSCAGDLATINLAKFRDCQIGQIEASGRSAAQSAYQTLFQGLY